MLETVNKSVNRKITTGKAYEKNKKEINSKLLQKVKCKAYGRTVKSFIIVPCASQQQNTANSL